MTYLNLNSDIPNNNPLFKNKAVKKIYAPFCRNIIIVFDYSQ